MTSDVALPPPPAVAPTQPDHQAARRANLLLFAGLLLLTLVFRSPGLVGEVFNSDETFLATQAEVINEGGNLYEDAADRKPPLVPYIYAATFAIFGTTALWSVRLVAMLAVALTAYLLAIEARRRYGPRAAWIAGILLVLSSVAFAPQDGQAANFEVFMLPSATAAILLASRNRAFSSGAAVALATLAKQTGAATLLPVLYILWRKRGRHAAQRALGGFSLPLAVVALAVGPGELIFWTTLGNGSYLSMNGHWAGVALLFIVMTLAFLACNLPIVWFVPRAWRERRTVGRADTDLWIWLATAAIAVAAGLRFFGHYYVQLLPPLCLITAGVLVRSRRVISTVTMTAAFVMSTAMTSAGFFMRPFGEQPQYKTVSTYVKQHIVPQDRILVWGHVPEIYWASGVLPATRFVTTGFLSGYDPGQPGNDARPEDATPGAWRSFFEDFVEHPPRYILDATYTRMRGSQYYPIWKANADLARIVFQQYEFVRAVDGFTIYERRADAPPPQIPPEYVQTSGQGKE